MQNRAGCVLMAPPTQRDPGQRQNLDVADVPISENFPEACCHTAPARWVGLHPCGRITRRPQAVLGGGQLLGILVEVVPLIVGDCEEVVFRGTERAVPWPGLPLLGVIRGGGGEGEAVVRGQCVSPYPAPRDRLQVKSAIYPSFPCFKPARSEWWLRAERVTSQLMGGSIAWRVLVDSTRVPLPPSQWAKPSCVIAHRPMLQTPTNSRHYLVRGL